MQLKVVSYNVRKAVGLDRRRRPDRILSILNSLDADVVLLQEADKRLGARPAALPRFLISQETEYRAVDIGGSDVSLGWHGNAILLRNGLTVSHAGRLELPGLEPRGAVFARIGDLTVVGTHLGLLRSWRVRQMHALADLLEPELPRVLVGGDFNEWSTSGGFAPWSHKLAVVAPGRSFHAARPVAELDRFALGSDVRLLRSGVEKRGEARLASDHLPVWAEVELRRKSTLDRPGAVSAD
jgi:endonuclease/exonuclease/phosphatase family metal-dependent hydrolase